MRIEKCGNCGKYFDPKKTDIGCGYYCSYKCCEEKWWQQDASESVLANEQPTCPCY